MDNIVIGKSLTLNQQATDAWFLPQITVTTASSSGGTSSFISLYK